MDAAPVGSRMEEPEESFWNPYVKFTQGWMCVSKKRADVKSGPYVFDYDIESIRHFANINNFEMVYPGTPIITALDNYKEV